MDKKKQEKPKSIGLITIIVIVLIVIVAVIFGVNHSKNGTEKNGALYTESEGVKTNTSKKLQEDKTVDGLKISDIELTYKENVSYLKAEVENTTNEKSGDFNINLKILDQNNQEIITIVGYIPEVEAGEKTVLDTAVTTDIAGAYNFEASRCAE